MDRTEKVWGWFLPQNDFNWKPTERQDSVRLMAMPEEAKRTKSQRERRSGILTYEKEPQNGCMGEGKERRIAK